jgi:hypothetical protein
MLVSIVFGHNNVTNEVINATCSLLNYVYSAQMPVISQEYISLMGDLLHDFHKNKGIFIHNGS